MVDLRFCFLILQENRRNCISRAGDQTAHKAITIEQLPDTILTPQSWLGQGLTDFMFVYLTSIYPFTRFMELAGNVPDVPKKVLRLISDRTEAFCLISEMFTVLDKRNLSLDFDILMFSFE